jgi:hypothetical protein
VILFSKAVKSKIPIPLPSSHTSLIEAFAIGIGSMMSLTGTKGDLQVPSITLA